MGSYRALGFDSSKEEMKEIIEILDPDNEGLVTYGMFLEVAALKMKSKFVFALQIIVVSC